MIKFISAAWSVWSFISPIYRDVMKAIAKVKESDLTDTKARDAVKQELTDLIQNHTMKNVPDSKVNAGIEICYQVYLISKKG